MRWKIFLFGSGLSIRDQCSINEGMLVFNKRSALFAIFQLY